MLMATVLCTNHNLKNNTMEEFFKQLTEQVQLMAKTMKIMQENDKMLYERIVALETEVEQLKAKQ